MKGPGTVSIVGAGPGNPALILVGEVVRVHEQLQQFEHQAEVYYGA
ncbi:hypothetical protein [Paenibacillus timonensis]